MGFSHEIYGIFRLNMLNLSRKNEYQLNHPIFRQQNLITRPRSSESPFRGWAFKGFDSGVLWRGLGWVNRGRLQVDFDLVVIAVAFGLVFFCCSEPVDMLTL